MDNEFVPYVEALELKKLGFDEPCLSYCEGESFSHHLATIEVGDEYITPVPLYQQAFRWFREKYNYWNYVYRCIHLGTWCYYIQFYNSNVWDKPWVSCNFNTYEEAELECLKKLIEITKKQNNG